MIATEDEVRRAREAFHRAMQDAKGETLGELLAETHEALAHYLHVSGRQESAVLAIFAPEEP